LVGGSIAGALQLLDRSGNSSSSSDLSAEQPPAFVPDVGASESPDQIDPTILIALTTRADGDIVPGGSF